jgi:hypothetical protein
MNAANARLKTRETPRLSMWGVGSSPLPHAIKLQALTATTLMPHMQGRASVAADDGLNLKELGAQAWKILDGLRRPVRELQSERP